VELPREFAPDAIFTSERAEWLYVLDAARLYACSTGADGRRIELPLQGERTGQADFENRPDRMAVPTTAGVELISLADPAAPVSELIWRPSGTPARAAHFAGEDLLAVLSDVVDTVRLGGGLHGQRLRFLQPVGDWDMLDLRRGVGLLALGSRDGRIAVYRSGTLFREWRVTQGTLHELHFADDAGTLVTRDGRGTLTHWAAIDPPGRTRLALLLASDWALSGDGSTAAIVTAGGPVALYRSREAAGLAFVSPGGGFARAQRGGRDTSISLNNDGTLLLQQAGSTLSLSSTDDIAASWNATWSDAETPVLREALLSPDGLMIAIHAESPTGHQQQVAFFEPVTPRRAVAGAGRGELAPLGPPVMLAGSPVHAVGFRPNSHVLVVARANGDLALVEAGSGKLLTWTALESPAYALAFNREGDQLAVACADGMVRLLNFETAELLGRFNVGRPVAALQFSPDGGLLMVRTDDGTLRLFELTGGEPVLRWLLPAGGERPLAIWMAPDTLLLAYEGRLNAHRLAAVDALVRANRRYPAQRPVIDAMEEGNFAAAWRQAAHLRAVNAPTGVLAQQEILESMLARRATPVPNEWIDQVVVDDDAAMLLRLGHAAYNGRRYAEARDWLRRGAVLLNGKLDAYTLWRIAQCDYLEEAYSDAARLLRELPMRNDFDALDIPRVQLELAAALFMADRPTEAQRVGLRIGHVPRVMLRNNPVATISAANIGKYIAGALNESWLVSSFTGLLAMFADGSLDVRDDPYFFFGEVARQRGEYADAMAHYQRCIETARDAWPSNWAALRIEQMTRAGPPASSSEMEARGGDAW
jgi:WD40 repeat protein